MLAPPAVQLVGQIDHADFRDAAELLCASAQLITPDHVAPELMVIAQSRPGAVCEGEVHALRRRAPLAGVVALLGSWCEGETRTGRPWPGVRRLYWYEFPAWWRRQLTLRAAGRCPDWARWGDCGLRIADCGLQKPKTGNRANGLVMLNAAWRDTAMALADVLQSAGYATAWQPPGRPAPVIRGVTAGVWVGGQLDEREANDLAAFCRKLACDAAPVMALLDFPRRDRCALARELGAATVLGKPWLNADLVATINDVVTQCGKSDRSPLAA